MKSFGIQQRKTNTAACILWQIANRGSLRSHGASSTRTGPLQYQRDSSHLSSESEDCAALEGFPICPAGHRIDGTPKGPRLPPCRVARLDHEPPRRALFPRGLDHHTWGCAGDALSPLAACCAAGRDPDPQESAAHRGARAVRGTTHPVSMGMGGKPGVSRPERLDPTVNPFGIVLLTPSRKPAKPSRKSKAVLDKLSQPALLSDRIQPLRRPTLRLKKT